MDYQKTVSVSGDPAWALETVRQVFIQQNFRITSMDPREFEAVGPGMNNNHGHPLLAVSRARVSLSGRSLSIEADLDSLRRFSRLMTGFIFGMAAFMLIIFSALAAAGLLHSRGHGAAMSIKSPWLFLLILAPFAPWPFLLPMIMGGVSKRAHQALETLMENAAGARRA